MAQRTGYLLIDHRASPGLPEDISIQSGFDPRLTREGKTYEADTLSCCHCKTVFIKNPLRTRHREQCPKCNHKYLCDWCFIQTREPDYSHMPFEKRLDLTLTGKLGSPSLLLQSAEKENV